MIFMSFYHQMLNCARIKVVYCVLVDEICVAGLLIGQTGTSLLLHGCVSCSISKHARFKTIMTTHLNLLGQWMAMHVSLLVILGQVFLSWSFTCIYLNDSQRQHVLHCCLSDGLAWVLCCVLCGCWLNLLITLSILMAR